jgi:hypothetical protein
MPELLGATLNCEAQVCSLLHIEIFNEVIRHGLRLKKDQERWEMMARKTLKIKIGLKRDRLTPPRARSAPATINRVEHHFAQNSKSVHIL